MTFKPSGTAAPITRETLQPVIDALVGAGVSANDIELLSQSYYYDYYYSSATLRATVNNVDIVDAAVEAAQDAADDIDSVYLNSTNVNYTLQNCETLERAAVQAAVEDAGDRAAVLADVLDVTLGDVAGASDYSWYNYGTGCGSDYYSPYPIAYTPWRVRRQRRRHGAGGLQHQRDLRLRLAERSNQQEGPVVIPALLNCLRAGLCRMAGAGGGRSVEADIAEAGMIGLTQRWRLANLRV